MESSAAALETRPHGKWWKELACLSWREQDMIFVFNYLRGCHMKEEFIIG